MIKVLIGDLFESEAHTLVNTVNCVGVMGKGIALEFKKRFSAMVKDYKVQCSAKTVKPGVPYLFKDLFGRSILNFPTKNHWRSPSKLDDIVHGLDLFTDHYLEWGIKTIAFPPLGCGNGGLDWKDVGPLMYQKLAPLEIDIEIYAPFGTAHEYLKPEFLAQETVVPENLQGVKPKYLRKEWVAILEVIDRLAQETYAPYVGRTVFQKICYVMTEQGIDTGFEFQQGAYGPYSAEVKEALKVFANDNLAAEQEFGKMTRLVIGSEYETLRCKYVDYLQQVENKINKVVDLFSRIKNTEQAEEVATVFYSVRQIKKSQLEVSEQDVLNYVLNWKEKWNTPEKKEAVAMAIRNLVILHWIKVDFSHDLINESEFF